MIVVAPLRRTSRLCDVQARALAPRHKDEDHHRGREHRPDPPGTKFGTGPTLCANGNLPEKGTSWTDTTTCDDRSDTPTSIHTEHGCVIVVSRALLPCAPCRARLRGCGVVSYVNRYSFLRTAFACIFAHYNTFERIFAHFLRAAF